MAINTSASTIRQLRSAGGIAALLTLGVVLITVAPGRQPAWAETCDQVVANADFEAGAAGWETQSAGGSELIVSAGAFRGTYGARLGGTDGADDRLAQWISFPSGSSSMGLTFFYRVETSDASDQPVDRLSVQLLGEQGEVLADLVQLSNLSAHGQWYRRVRFFDPAEAQALAGRRAQLMFRATTDAVSPSTFLLDDIELEVCVGGPPALSDLRMSSAIGDPPGDHFPDGAEEIRVSFAFDSIGKDDEVRLRIRDVNGTSMLDHTYGELAGSGRREVGLTALDAVDGLVRSALEAGNSVLVNAERAMQASSRFSMAPFLEQALLAVSVLQDAAAALAGFDVGEPAQAYLAQAQDRVQAALEAGQQAADPASTLEQSRALISTMRDEAQVAAVRVAEARSALRSGSLTFPGTVGCQFNLTNIYLNGFPVDSIEWTVGTAGPPERIHPPLERRRAGALHIQPPLIYTQGVTPAGAPHVTAISGRVVDTDCRPAADGTRVALFLDVPSLGRLVPGVVTTAGGFFTTSLWTTENLGSGAVTVLARAGAAEASGVVFLVGPPASLVLSTATFTVNPGAGTTVVVQVRDARGQAVANGTEVAFNVSPPEAGAFSPNPATTVNGFAATTFVAGSLPGYVTLRAVAGDAQSVTVIEIARPASTATPAPPATPTATPRPSSTPLPSPTPTPVCDSSDPEQMCNGIVSVRVFEDARCDGQFNNGTDRALFGVPVSLIYPDGTSLLRTSDISGYAHFGGVRIRGDEQVGVLVEYPEDMITSGLTPCQNSGTLAFLGRRDFGSFGTAAVRFRTHRQIVTRRGFLRTAEASLCFTAKYFLDPTDGGPIAYLLTDEELAAYVGRQVQVTGSTWEIEFCRYLLPFSIELVP